ncbi:MAG TPA: hypothetical protein DGT23_16525 [Micromonosporaceae bacterium]|nr:hypothetical protein [Micromonosporaceae bacterium]
MTPPAGGIATTIVADARGQTVERHQYRAPTPVGPADVTRYTYTPTGQLAKLTDPAGNAWRYTYDLRGRQIRAEDSDKGVSVSEYDSVGQLISQTDARGQTLSHAYDILGRRTGVRAGGPSGRLLAAWTFDTVPYGKGRPATSTAYDEAGNAYASAIGSYSALYQPLQATLTVPSSEGLLAKTYTSFSSFNPDGSLSGRSLPAGGGLFEETVRHTYDDAGRPLTTYGGPQGTTVTYASATSYTRYGERQRLQLGTGTGRVWLSHYFEDATRRTQRSIVDAEVPQPMQADLHYTHDPAGNVTAIADRVQDRPADVQCFRYDHLRRLTEAWTPPAGCDANPTTAALAGPAPYWQSYTYDLIGNRTTNTSHTALGDTVRRHSHPDAGAARPHALTSVTTTTPGTTTTTTAYGYDAAGNTTSRGAQQLSWNEQGRLATVTDNGATTSFVYDAGGERLLRREPGAVTLYLGGQELRLDRASGAVTATRYYTHGGTTVAVRTAAGLDWLAGDHHGTATIAINSTRLTATVRRTDPFGNLRGAPPSNWPGEKGFVGGTIDAGTGLTHLGAREFDPALGRFISVDPVLAADDPQQLNAYTYANNSPVTFSDPTGLACVDCVTGAAMEAKPSNYKPRYKPRPRVGLGLPKPRPKPRLHPGCDGRTTCARPSAHDEIAPPPPPPRQPRPGCDGRMNCANPSAHDEAPLVVVVNAAPTAPKANHPSLPSNLGGSPMAYGLQFIQPSPTNPLILNFAMQWADGGSVSVCFGITGAAGNVVGAEACVAADQVGLGVGYGFKQGVGAVGYESAVDVKISSAGVDQLGGRETYIAKGRYTFAIGDDGNTTHSLSFPVGAPRMKGDHAGRGQSTMTRLFTWEGAGSWWQQAPDMSGGGLCGAYSNC